MSFSTTAKQCASVLQAVLTGHINRPDQLQAAWPPEAEAYEVLNLAHNDVYEYWLLHPAVEYASSMKASVEVLASASDDPIETLTRWETAIDNS